MKRGRLRRKTPLKMKSPLRAHADIKPRRPQRLPVSEIEKDREAQLAWQRYAVLRARGCCECGECPVSCVGGPDDRLEAHHVLPQERIKRYVKSLQLPAQEAREYLRELLWSSRNVMALIQSRHAAHTNQTRPVSQAALRREHWEFARELGLDYVLERSYDVALPEHMQ